MDKMHSALEDIPDRILYVAQAALAQANNHAVFDVPGAIGWEQIGVLNAAHAGELFIKAIIAKEHPLLIFCNPFSVENSELLDLDIDHLIQHGKTYDFKDLPRLLWVTTGQRIPDIDSFNAIRKTRNAIQHFCAPDSTDLRQIALEFTFKNIDPLIRENFGLYAIEYHEDFSLGYDYVVEMLMRRELLFSIPDDFSISEFDLPDMLSSTPKEYQKEFKARLAAKGISL